MSNRAIKLGSLDVVPYYTQLPKKTYKRDIKRRRRTLEKRFDTEDSAEGCSYEWYMCDEISLANGAMIDYYEYWKHPAFVDEEVNDGIR